MTALAPKTSQPYAALALFMRGLGALISMVSAIGGIYLVYEMIVDSMHGKMGSLGWFGTLIAVLITATVFGAICKYGYDVFRKIDATTVTYFVCAMAIFCARDIYHLVPWFRPDFIAIREGTNLIFFYVFYRLVRMILMRVFELNPSASSLAPDDPDIPEFPQKSPLIPL